MNFIDFCNTTNDSDYNIKIADSLPITFSNSSGVTFSVTAEEIYKFLKEFYNDFTNKIQTIEPANAYEEKKFRSFYKSFESDQTKTVITLGGNQTKGITGLLDKIICFVTDQPYKGYNDLHFDKNSLNQFFFKYPNYSNSILSNNTVENLTGPYASLKEVALEALFQSYANNPKFSSYLIIDEFTARIEHSYVYYWVTEKGINEKKMDQRVFKDNTFIFNNDKYYLSDQWTWDSEKGRSIVELNKFLKLFGLRIIEKEKRYWITKISAFNKMFVDNIINSNLKFESHFTMRFISSLMSKSFVILTGLSGSGKTKLAQAFAEWICEDTSQICLIPVGADWTSREPLLGYPNALEPGRYVKPDNGVVDLLIDASKPGNKDKPHFLILDEMNLSHVERYFADFLSVMETGGTIPLHSDTGEWTDDNGNAVPAEVALPANLFIIGTVNIDETTYMFSPKVLDRANVIEFRVTEKDLDEFLENPFKPDLDKIKGAGAGMASDFLRIAREEITDFKDKGVIKSSLVEFFKELKKTGSEFGYRTSSEIFRLTGILRNLTEAEGKPWSTEDIIDAAILQKLLPKLHGSKKKLEKVLEALGRLCLKKDLINPDDIWKKLIAEPDLIDDSVDVRFKRSLEKILRMKRRADQDGFTSFAEA